MRTLMEIVEAAKIGDPTTHDECLYALLAYAGLAYFDTSALRDLALEPPSPIRTPRREAEESFRRWQAALAKSPREWLGPTNDPANEACRRRVRASRQLFDAVLARAEAKAGLS